MSLLNGTELLRLQLSECSLAHELDNVSTVWMGISMVWRFSLCTPIYAGCRGHRFGLHRVHPGHRGAARCSILGRPFLHHAAVAGTGITDRHPGGHAVHPLRHRHYQAG